MSKAHNTLKNVAGESAPPPALHPPGSVRVLDADVAQIREEAEKEAEHWKSLGDMYGWNFWKGVASGAIKVQLRFQALNGPDQGRRASDSKTL